VSWAIFISYRRGPTAAVAAALWRALTRRFDTNAVFFDVESIGAGQKFRPTIEFALSSCEVMLVLIGAKWAPPRLSVGSPFGDAFDFVQHEVARALQRGVHVLPVLVDGARLPEKKDLPNDVHALLEYQVQVLRSEALEEDLEAIFSWLSRLPELSGKRLTDQDRYVARMSNVFFPTKPLASLVKNSADRCETVTLRRAEASEAPAPEAALQALNAKAKTGASWVELVSSQIEFAEAYMARGQYVSVNAALSLANDAINAAMKRAAADSRFEGLEVETVVRLSEGKVQSWMIEAQQRVTMAQVVFHGTGVLEPIANFHTTAGRYFSSLGDIAQAQRHYFEAKLLFDAACDIGGLIVSLTNLGHCDDKSGRWDAAEGKWREAMRWAEAFDAHQHMAGIGTNLGALFRRRGRLDLARGMLGDAVELAQKLGDLDQVACSGRELALLHFEAGELAEAERWHRRVLDIERGQKNADGIARQLHNLASVHAERQDYVGAEKLLREALEINRLIGRSEGVALQLTNLGKVLRDLDRTDEAREALHEALRLNEELQQPMRIAETCLNLATVEDDQGRSEVAVELLQGAIDLTRTGPHRATLLGLLALAALRERRGEFVFAADSYEEALPLLEAPGQEGRRGGVLVLLGSLANELGRHEEALSRYREALEIFARQDEAIAKDLREAIAEVCRKLGR
jgi:tetratricopeptide (TPR) repeat protein